MISGHVEDDNLAARLLNLAGEIDVATTAVVFAQAAALQTQVRANASTASHPDRASRNRGHIPGTGPGPNVGTGDYRRSIRLETGREDGEPVALVYSNAVQARRLEYGFIGTDSLGRSYRQPPYPHWEPAMNGVEAKLRAELLRRYEGLLRKYLK